MKAAHAIPGALLIPVPEAARLLGIGQTHAWGMVREGTLPAVRLGRAVRVPRSHIDSLVEEATHAAKVAVGAR
jgi:excisionase family DNA binding protein